MTSRPAVGPRTGRRKSRRGCRCRAWSGPSEQVGTITAAAADETGLPEGTPVVAGTIDAWAEAFSVGVRRPGELMLMYGSTMFFIQITRQRERSPLLWTTQAIEPGTRSLAAGMSTSGSLIEWLRDLVGNPDRNLLTAEAERVPPGANGLLILPYFEGERTPIYDPRARGIIAGLTLRHRQPDLLRAAYEATGFAARQILDLFPPPTRVVAVGGGTRTRLWTHIVSDITGIAQQIPAQTIGAAYGDALLAAIATGLVPTDTDWSTTATTITPTETEAYDELYQLYRRLYEDTATIVHQLGRPNSRSFRA